MKTKRNLIQICLLCVAMLPTVTQAQDAYSTNADGSIYTYSTNADGSCTIVAYAGPSWAVTIPSNINGLLVNGIGNDAFANSDLTSIVIPANVTNIGVGAFSDCFSLTSITIGPNVASIGAFAFASSGLTSISIPDSVTNIGEGSFSECFAYLTVDQLNAYYSSSGGVVFDKNKTTLVAYSGSLYGSYTIPGTVTRIGDYAFAWDYLTGLTIPGSVTSIGNYAFYSCGGMTNFSISGSVTNIGDAAFAACYGVSSITVDGSNAFYGSTNGVLFNKNQTTLIEYPQSKSGSSYVVPTSVTNIADYAFYGCALTNVTIPNSNTGLGTGAFANCYNFATVTIPGGITNFANVFSGCPIWSVTIDYGATSIADGEFTAYHSLENVVIPNSVTSIGNYAFESCDLTNITIPDGVTNIGVGAFESCALTNLVIPGSVTSVGYVAFANCSYLTTVAISRGVTNFANIFAGCPIRSAIIDNGVTSIMDDEFNNYHGLVNVVVPNSVTNIGDGAFNGCALPSVTIPDSVTSIGAGAFGSTGLTNVTIGNGVTIIGTGAFESCYNLKSITIPNSVITIGPSAFGDTVLTNVIIGNRVTDIGEAAFGGDNGLTSIIIPASVTNIEYEAFNSCLRLTSIYFEGNAPTAGLNIFEDALYSEENETAYYLPGTTGWGPTFGTNPAVPTALWSLPYPLILNDEPNFGVQINRFGFTISWANKSSVVVEASTNLANLIWTPIATNTLTGGSSYFSDPQWTNYPGRYYRLSSP